MIGAIFYAAKILKNNHIDVEKLTYFFHIVAYIIFLLYLCTRIRKKMEVLTDIMQPVENAWRGYERVMEQCLRSDNRLQQEVLAYVGSRRGKQLRPLVTILSAQLCNPVTDKTFRTAAALELLHTASLVHDDVVDSSDTRRGMAAVHTKWGNKIAILVGDYMLAKVIGLIAEVRNTRILEIVSNLGKSLSSGELVQLHVGQSMWIDEERYMQIIDQKTAQLFQACAEAGAESAGCTQRQRTALHEFGRMLGICFQIKDDLFDYSDLEDIGKPTMSDLRDGKVTLPLIASLNRATKEEAEHIREIGELLAAHSESIDQDKVLQEIKSFVLRYRGDEYAVQLMNECKQKAIEALSVFHDCVEKTSLIRLLDFAINRIH